MLLMQSWALPSNVNMNSSPQIYTFFKARVALHAILRSAGVGSGDQVLLPGYTCVVVPNAINYLGAEPVYIDIEKTTYNLDCDLLEASKGSMWTPEKAKAIIVQHTYGMPCDMDRILEFAEKYNLFVIEDSCHALGSTWRGQQVGSFGDAAFFSSQWSKPITTGLGGWAQINSSELQNNLDAILREYKRPKLSEAFLLELQYLAFSTLNHPRLFWIIQGIYRTLGKVGLAIGSSSGAELNCELPTKYQKTMHPLQQRRLRRLLKNIDHTIVVRRRNTAMIESALSATGIPTVAVQDCCNPVFLRYPVLVENKVEVLREAKKRRVQLGDWFLSPIHPNLEQWELAGYTPGSCPVAEDVSRRVVNISTEPRTGGKEIRRTVAFLAEFGQPTHPHQN
jgi:perosamine synthetase